jgi:hypothetical protein
MGDKLSERSHILASHFEGFYLNSSEIIRQIVINRDANHRQITNKWTMVGQTCLNARIQVSSSCLQPRAFRKAMQAINIRYARLTGAGRSYRQRYIHAIAFAWLCFNGRCARITSSAAIAHCISGWAIFEVPCSEVAF